MSKYCIECRNELPDEAKFCMSCGKQQNITEENVEIEPIESPQESTGPAALDLKAAYNLVSETQNLIDNLVSEAENLIKNGLNVNVFEKQIINKMENDLKTADDLAKKVKNMDPDVVIKDPFTNEMITCDHVISLSCYLMGVIGYNFVIYQGRRNIDANKIILRKAQTNFIESNSIMPTAAAQYNIALAMDMQTDGIIRMGEFILDVNGNRTFLTPLSSKKAKRIVYDAYQR
ncbi:unnamed protein product, partial [marine sediment metagenome]